MLNYTSEPKILAYRILESYDCQFACLLAPVMQHYVVSAKQLPWAKYYFQYLEYSSIPVQYEYDKRNCFHSIHLHLIRLNFASNI